MIWKRLRPLSFLSDRILCPLKLYSQFRAGASRSAVSSNPIRGRISHPRRSAAPFILFRGRISPAETVGRSFYPVPRPDLAGRGGRPLLLSCSAAGSRRPRRSAAPSVLFRGRISRPRRSAAPFILFRSWISPAETHSRSF